MSIQAIHWNAISASDIFGKTKRLRIGVRTFKSEPVCIEPVSRVWHPFVIDSFVDLACLILFTTCRSIFRVAVAWYVPVLVHELQICVR